MDASRTFVNHGILVNRGILINLIYHPVYVLGPGERVGLWTQGCSIKCKGCMSKHTWAFDKKKEMNIKTLIDKLKSYNCNRLTISGGEPFDQPEAFFELLKAIRNIFTDILVYTGYRMEIIQEKFKEHLKFIDVLVDGEFIDGLESDLIYKGSQNQRIFVLNNNLLNIYKDWMSKKKEKILQIVEKENGIYIIGIPYQEDIRRLMHEI